MCVGVVKEAIDQCIDLPEFTDEIAGEALIGAAWPFAGVGSTNPSSWSHEAIVERDGVKIWTYGVEQEVVDRPGPIIQALLHQLLPGVDDCDFVGLVEFLNRILRGSRIRHNACSALLSYAVFDVVVRLPRDCQFFAKLCDRLAVTNGIEICDLSTLMQWNSHPAIPPPQTSKKSLAITILEHILPMRSALSFVSRPCLNFHFQNLLSTSTGVRYLELLWRAYPYTTMGGSVH